MIANDKPSAISNHIEVLPIPSIKTFLEWPKRTASKDLQYLLGLGLIEKEGTTGRGVLYRIAKGAPKGHNEHRLCFGKSIDITCLHSYSLRG